MDEGEGAALGGHRAELPDEGAVSEGHGGAAGGDGGDDIFDRPAESSPEIVE
jgi:hypothetical protein